MVQLEFGFLLGPADGRYLIRSDPDGEPEFVIVLRTLGAPQRRLLRRRRPRRAGTQPAAVPTARAGVVRAEPLGTAEEAQAWLERIRRDREGLERELDEAGRELNRLIRAHRAAAGDPYARDVGPERALVVRIGHGTGEEVADGRFAAAYEVPRVAKRARRTERLSPQERLAAIVGGREPALVSDELVLRARADVDAGRPREAALQARIALECVLEELPAERLGGLHAELERDRRAVSEAATAALAGEPTDALSAGVAEAVRRMELALARRRAAAS